ncbi:hypothetical protein O181_018114 [Austropuccinia psidii MF-1]|uniref:Uncharacterized protein n=1 Tax=Austropuccinia psidii MF-1 TaxID=1389203 RepID=A0A9Q3C717_9BASI|nr:hypothetical protein [Austropuccinia psidii MF-1]
MPQDTENKNLGKHTQDAQTFLVTLTKGMAYIHGTDTKITVSIDNAQHPFIIGSGAHGSIVARNYMDHYLPNWEKQVFPTKAKNLKSASGKMTSIGTIIKEIIIPHRKGNIRLNQEFVLLEDAHIQGFVLGTDYQRMYCIKIYNSKNRHVTIGTKREKKFSLDIYQISTHDPLEELPNEFMEGQFSITLTIKQKLNLLNMLRKNRPAFAIGEEPLGKIRGHDIELYLDEERPYPPMLRRPPYQESLETSKGFEKHINELLEIDVIRNIGHNEIVEITTPVLMTWHDGRYRLCGNFRALNNYTKADRYPTPRLPHDLDKLVKAKYITKMDCMKGSNQNGVKPNSMKLLGIIFHMGIYEYTRMSFGIKNSPSHSQSIMDKIFQEEILEGWMVVYIVDLIIYSETSEDNIQYIDRVLNRRKNFRFSEWAKENGTPDSGDTGSGGTETPILGISSSELHNELFNAVMKTNVKHKQCSILLQLIQQKLRSPELQSKVGEPWYRDYKDNKCFFIDGLLYHREKHTSALTVVERDRISLILKECHDCPYMGHMSEESTKERVASTAWWPKWEQDYCRNQIINFAHITSSMYKLCSKDVLFEITKERRDSYETIKHELTNSPLHILPDFELAFKLYIDAAGSQGLGEVLHQRQIVDGELREGVIC